MTVCGSIIDQQVSDAALGVRVALCRRLLFPHKNSELRAGACPLLLLSRASLPGSSWRFITHIRTRCAAHPPPTSDYLLWSLTRRGPYISMTLEEDDKINK